MKFLLSFFIGLFLLACAGLSSSKVTLGTMTDPRDGRTYKTVKIGSQTWMAQNLNYKKLVNTNTHHCHLSYHWAACWIETIKGIELEVTYVGSRENAPY